MKFERDSEELPLLLKLGGGYEIADHWVSALDTTRF